MVVASIVGGAGRMGAWFATFLKENGYEVIISDKNKNVGRKIARSNGFRFVNNNSEAVRSAQLVILATPTTVTKTILEQVKRHVPSSALLVEISSIKGPLRKPLQSLQRQQVAILSIHPMFGPGAKTISGKVILAVSVPSGSRAAKKFLALLGKQGAKIIRCNLEDHDKLASTLLALPHFVNIVMINTLQSLAVDLNCLCEIAGTTFKLQLLTAEAVYQEDPANEVSIFMDNKYSMNALRKFADQTSATLNIIKSAKRTNMLRNLSHSRRFLQKDLLFASAYERFNAAVEASGVPS